MSIESALAKVSLSALRGASKATRDLARREGYDLVTATKAVNDVVREGVNNFYGSSGINAALKGYARAVNKGNDPIRQALPVTSSPNTSGFADDVSAFYDHAMWYKSQGKKPPVYNNYGRLPKVPKGTVVNDVAKKRSKRSARGAM